MFVPSVQRHTPVRDRLQVAGARFLPGPNGRCPATAMPPQPFSARPSRPLSGSPSQAACKTSAPARTI
eukprot:5944052-Pleurochrysis_carterae.AAC.1